eukprot:TRINITY_DN62519_c0_g1_i1.p2 TRINITY_DN62519_c0_g1~~TRINITY_DN62519_c0_g1_i1.p2  ORF type:complete len:126 (+),score=37.00 TRINITY_DN62519_c0_g1_i1:104-481(+)
MCIRDRLGGTHGNEMAGIHLVRKIKRSPASFQRPGIRTLPVLANPQAVEQCTRFVDCDLNRCFTAQVLEAEPGDGAYEHTRARELVQELGAASVVLDVHNTTSNAGTMIIFGTCLLYTSPSPRDS